MEFIDGKWVYTGKNNGLNFTGGTAQSSSPNQWNQFMTLPTQDSNPLQTGLSADNFNFTPGGRNFTSASNLNYTPMPSQNYNSSLVPNQTTIPDSNSGFGFNTNTLNLGLAGLNTIGGLYFGNKQLGLANKQFEETSRMNNANLAAQKFAFADTYENRARRAQKWNGTSQEELDAKLANMKRVFA